MATAQAAAEIALLPEDAAKLKKERKPPCESWPEACYWSLVRMINSEQNMMKIAI